MEPWSDRERVPPALPAEVFGDIDYVYHSYAPLLRNIAMRKFSIPSADAEALVHDVFATYIATQSRVFNTRSYLIAAVCQAAKRYRHHRRGDVRCTSPRRWWRYRFAA